MGLMLAVNVAVGVADMNFAELGKQIDAGAVSRPEVRTTELPIADIAGEHRTTQIVDGLFQGLEQCSMAWRHVVPHLLQIHGQGIWGMGDSQSGIETGHNGALRAGLAAKLLRLPGIGATPS